MCTITTTVCHAYKVALFNGGLLSPPVVLPTPPRIFHRYPRIAFGFQVLARRALLLRLWKELDLLISAKQGVQPTTVSESTTDPCTSRVPRCSDDSLGAKARAAAAAPRVGEVASLLNGGLLTNENTLLLLLEPTVRGTWRLKPHVRLHLYISDAPCGDASIYEQTQAPPPPPPRPQALSVSEREAPTPYAGSKAHTAARQVSAEEKEKPVVHSAVPAGEDASPIERSVYPEENGRTTSPRVCRVGCSGGHSSSEDVATSVPCDDERVNPERIKRCRYAAEDEGLLSSIPHAAPGTPLEGRGTPDKIKIGTSEEDPRLAEKRGGGGGKTEVMAFTGAKIIASVKNREVHPDMVLGGDLHGPTVKAVLRIDREQEQALGALRIKSSRSNISEEGRTMSLSCSDKLAKWALLGLQVWLPVEALSRTRRAALAGSCLRLQGFCHRSSVYCRSVFTEDGLLLLSIGVDP